ncbi:MAG: hypothetical protein H6R26_1217 [Proteobacteria bacterium]|nr:hypothetical protein [Pseudomonadota bacterium]
MSTDKRNGSSILLYEQYFVDSGYGSQHSSVQVENQV